MTYLRGLGLEDDAAHGENDAGHQAQLHADESRGGHRDQPHDGIVPAGPPLSRDIFELPQRPPEADNDDACEDAPLKIVKERCEEEQDEENNQGADQTGHLMEGEKYSAIINLGWLLLAGYYGFYRFSKALPVSGSLSSPSPWFLPVRHW